MGKVKFSKLQQFVFDKFSQNEFLCRRFYFTGGTALSVFYLAHRVSEDLDFFSEKDFDDEPIYSFTREISRELGCQERFTRQEMARIFELVKDGKPILKIDFAFYPFERLKKGKRVKGVTVDSLLDIAVNKLLLVNQRGDVKDFVDLYFLRNEFTVWDLMARVKKKFGFQLDSILVAADFMKVEQFDFLPKILVPLKISDLHAYFKQRAREISSKLVE